MRQLLRDNGSWRFVGSLHLEADRAAAAVLAADCAAYRIDEDDEDYLNGSRSCYNCRYRRWLSDGFICTRHFPPKAMERS